MNKENDLKKISLLYNSDKVEHGYIDIYHEYFKKIKDEKLKILEIGIADGYSLLTWSDYFKNSTIIGIDIHKIDIEEKKLDRILCIPSVGNSWMRSFLKVILDDNKLSTSELMVKNIEPVDPMVSVEKFNHMMRKCRKRFVAVSVQLIVHNKPGSHANMIIVDTKEKSVAYFTSKLDEVCYKEAKKHIQKNHAIYNQLEDMQDNCKLVVHTGADINNTVKALQKEMGKASIKLPIPEQLLQIAIN